MGYHLKLCDVIGVVWVLVNNKPTVSWAEQNQGRFWNRLENTHIPLQKKMKSSICSYFMKSVYSIQKTPSLLPWAISSWRRCCGQSVHSSDQLPFHEKRPHGFRSRSSLRRGQRSDMEGGRRSTGRKRQKQDPVKVSFSQRSFPSLPRLILLLLWMIAYFLTTHFILLPPPSSDKLGRYNGKPYWRVTTPPPTKKGGAGESPFPSCFSSPTAPSRRIPTRFRSSAVAQSSTPIALWQ